MKNALKKSSKTYKVIGEIEIKQILGVLPNPNEAKKPKESHKSLKRGKKWN